VKLPRFLNPAAYNWDAIFARLQNLPTLNVRALALIVLDYATLAWGWTLSYQTDNHGDQGVFNAWLLFLAGMHGFGAWSYQVKRQTSNDKNADEDSEQIIPPRADRIKEDLTNDRH
jgi:hypothetical protein